MDEETLTALKNQFQSERSNLIQRYTSFNASTYYASLNGLTGETFLNQLHIILSTNIYQVSYGEARFILEESDAVNSPWGTYLYGIYSNHKIVRYWDGGSTWAREHVWPNSKLGVSRVDNNNRNIASDPHNLRAINPSVNSTRSNRYFINGTSSSNQTVGTNGYYPGDDHRGDVARILFYMYVRYLGQLDLVNTASEILSGENYKPSGAKFGILSILIDWHEQDPVSDFEINRNNVIYSYQGNRNPFIDNPEYVSIIFSIMLAKENEKVTITITITKTEINLNELNKRKYYFV
jgi:endonuclease I